MTWPHIDSPPRGTPEWDAYAAEDKGYFVTVLIWLSVALATLFVIGRVFVRLKMYKKLQIDDYLCLFGLVRISVFSPPLLSPLIPYCRRK